MYGAHQGIIPTNLFDQSFMFEALINGAYIGRSATRYSVLPFSFHSPVGSPGLPPDGHTVYLCYIVADAAATVNFSAAGKATIQTTVAQLGGTMIFFDTIDVQAGGPCPFQLYGFKINMEGAAATPLAMVPPALASYPARIRVGGGWLPYTSVIENMEPVQNPWISLEYSQFILQYYKPDGTRNAFFTCRFRLPKQGRGSAANDYQSTVFTAYTCVITDGGADWIIQATPNFALTGQRTLAFTPWCAVGRVFLNNSSLPGVDITIVDVVVDGLSLAGASFPVEPGTYDAGTTAATGLVDVVVDLAGTIPAGYFLEVNDLLGVPAQALVPGVYNYVFTGIDLTFNGISVNLFKP